MYFTQGALKAPPGAMRAAVALQLNTSDVGVGGGMADALVFAAPPALLSPHRAEHSFLANGNACSPAPMSPWVVIPRTHRPPSQPPPRGYSLP